MKSTETIYSMDTDTLYAEAVELLKQLISMPSFSREEGETAALIEHYLHNKGIEAKRHLNNIWCSNKYFDPQKPTVLLNSHHDTVKPNRCYTMDPFQPVESDGKLYGLGSNDAGGPLVSLIATFVYFWEEELPYNLILAATAEEEISGLNGLESILSFLPQIDLAIVGEPTLTNLAVAEKGLLVLDCLAHGRAGHAAREEGDNAIYKALQDIAWFQSYRFPRVSKTLGPVKMSVTVVNTENKAHNVVPDACSFVVDVRVTDEYTHEEILDTIRQHVRCEIKPRSLRLRASMIAENHPLVQAGLRLGKTAYGSPTTSDQALIAAPSLKCGPGDSARSHTADEFIYLHEIREGIHTYISMLERIKQPGSHPFVHE